MSITNNKEAAPAGGGANLDDTKDVTITSTRTGKGILIYEQLYGNPSAQKVLQSNTEARSQLKAKLCELGLTNEVLLFHKKNL